MPSIISSKNDTKIRMLSTTSLLSTSMEFTIFRVNVLQNDIGDERRNWQSAILDKMPAPNACRITNYNNKTTKSGGDAHGGEDPPKVFFINL